MPELPEVEVVRRGLLPHVLGRRIHEVTVHEPRSVRRHGPGAEDLADRLRGLTVQALVRRGKFLWWRLTDESGADVGEALMTHLGMSGQLRVRDGSPLVPPGAGEGPAPDPHRHRRLTLAFEGGSAVDFVDQRIFGGLWLSPLVEAADGAIAGEGSPDALLPTDVAHVARDLLDPALDENALVRRLRSRRAPVKSLLLAQDLVSGIGNIYADEGLWAARVRFDTPAENLSVQKLRRLLEETRAVMQRALEVGGTSFDDLYVNVEGRSGYFARSLAVYGKDGEACPRCGTVIVRERFTNRSSHFCPRCQRRR